jgi:hypothetical protein
MTRAPCARLWEVEAARNGQLTGHALTAHQRHAGDCSECTDAARYYDSLARALQQDTEAVDEVAMRRIRLALMQRAALLAHPPTPRSFNAPNAKRWALGVVALTIGVLLAFQGLRWPSAQHEPVAVTTADARSQWSRHHGHQVERIELHEGEFNLAVHRQAGDPRVIFLVPDGEIEDLGTTFKVSVHGGHTVEIAVTEGAVLYRPLSQAPLRLSAGMSWRPRATTNVQTTATVVVPSATPTIPKTMVHSNARMHRDARAASEVASSDDHTAMEDAAYLQLLALVREGRDAEARLAAATYLRNFPNGFRSIEVQRIAQHP